MKMKAIYILLILLAPALAMAQYKGKINVTPLKLEQKGDSLYISIDINMQDVRVDTRRSVELIPVLTAPEMEKALPAVLLKGKSNYHIWQRKLTLMNRKERLGYLQDAPYTVAKGFKSKDERRITYNKVIPFEAWMKDARLDIRKDVCGCGNPPSILEVSQLAQVQLEKIVVPYTVTPHLAYITPEVEAVKRREMSGEAFLDFVVGKTDILPDYMNNPGDLQKITNMMAALRNDPAVTVKGIVVSGYASPEGTLKMNQTLSEGRAKALTDYLVPKFDYPENLYTIAFGGENWAGLLEKVEASDMKHREEVVRTLTTVPAEINYRTNNSRKKSLMQLAAGVPYRFMLKEYFPHLRKAVCKVDYEVRGFNAEEAREVIKTQPQNLSLNEMYMAANTYEAGSPEFTGVFETAARMYPSDATANVNAASAALARGDTVSAGHYLEKVETPSPEYDNTMGVLMLLRDDYRQAEEYLTRAAASGSPSASRNLEELYLKLDNIRQLREQDN